MNDEEILVIDEDRLKAGVAAIITIALTLTGRPFGDFEAVLSKQPKESCLMTGEEARACVVAIMERALEILRGPR